MECHLILSISCCNTQCITDTSRSPLGIKDGKLVEIEVIKEVPYLFDNYYRDM